MSEEIPPSALVTRPAPPATGRLAASRYTLRLTTSRWAAIPAGPPGKAAATVVGAWLVLAWNRFGFQGLGQPRVMTRFVLIGVYGWLGLVAITWLVHRVRTVGGPSDGGRRFGADKAGRLLQVIGLSHLPLVVLAVIIQVGQAVPIPLVVPVLTAAVFLLWFPGMLLFAVAEALSNKNANNPSDNPAEVGGKNTAMTMATTAVTYLVWLGTVGRYLLDQLAHLI